MILISSGHIDVTPAHPLPLAGFADRPRSFDAILDELEINLIVLKDGHKHYLIYSVDTLFVPEDFVQIVLSNFGSRYEIHENQIWICASHTHFAPSLDPEKPALGKADKDYCQNVASQLIALTQSVLEQDFTEVTIEYRQGTADLNVNRRKKLLRLKDGKLICKTLMLPDYDGPRDTSLHTFRFVGEDGKVAAFLWSYACHPVHVFQRNSVSADYAGGIRENLRNYFQNSNLTVGFLQGFAGNLKADITTVTNTRFSDRLRYLLQLGPKYTRFPDSGAYQSWVSLLSTRVISILETVTSTKLEGPVKSACIKRPLGNFIGEIDNRNLSFKHLDFGGKLSLVSINAEVVIEYGKLLKELFPGKNVIGVGYTEGTRIYLPVDSMLPEKGYEVDGFKKLFNIEGDFKPLLNQEVSNAIRALK